MNNDILKKLMEKIRPLDQELMAAAQKRLDSLTKPLGSLGRMEDIAKQIVGITGKTRPTLKNKVIFTFAADHGVIEEGVSAYPREVTAQMVYNFLTGGAGISVLARHAGARVVVADLGVACDLSGCKGLVNKKIAAGTKNMHKWPAMTREEAYRAVEAGISIFNDELPAGLDISGTGDMGIGNTTAAAAITAVFTSEPVENLTGRGTGIDDEALKNKIKIIKESLEVNKPDKNDAFDVLSKVGGFEIGGLAGVILASAANRVPVVIDGFISGAAALIAYHIEPKVKEYMIAGHLSVERGHKAILEHAGLLPLLDMNLRLGEGTGAALAMTIIDASLKIFNEMATFGEAHVSEQNK